jgi:hypothetical protein
MSWNATNATNVTNSTNTSNDTNATNTSNDTNATNDTNAMNIYDTNATFNVQSSCYFEFGQLSANSECPVFFWNFGCKIGKFVVVQF